MPRQGMLTASVENCWDEFGGCLVCPVCGFDYVHLQSVEVDQGASIATVDRAGCRLVGRASADIAHRGSAIRLRLWCEAGHRFSQVLRFHKGMTFVRVDVDDEIDPGAPGCRDELWRD